MNFKVEEPNITSSDCDARINEQGRPTPKYFELRSLIGNYAPSLPDPPEPIPATGLPEIQMEAYASLWDNLPAAQMSVQPRPFEVNGQDYGFILCRTKLIGYKSGRLTIADLHDFATVFLNGEYVGKLDRREGESAIEVSRR